MTAATRILCLNNAGSDRLNSFSCNMPLGYLNFTGGRNCWFPPDCPGHAPYCACYRPPPPSLPNFRPRPFDTLFMPGFFNRLLYLRCSPTSSGRPAISTQSKINASPSISRFSLMIHYQAYMLVFLLMYRWHLNLRSNISYLQLSSMSVLLVLVDSTYLQMLSARSMIFHHCAFSGCCCHRCHASFLTPFRYSLLRRRSSPTLTILGLSMLCSQLICSHFAL